MYGGGDAEEEKKGGGRVTKNRKKKKRKKKKKLTFIYAPAEELHTLDLGLGRTMLARHRVEHLAPQLGVQGGLAGELEEEARQQACGGVTRREQHAQDLVSDGCLGGARRSEGVEEGVVRMICIITTTRRRSTSTTSSVAAPTTPFQRLIHESLHVSPRPVTRLVDGAGVGEPSQRPQLDALDGVDAARRVISHKLAFCLGGGGGIEGVGRLAEQEVGSHVHGEGVYELLEIEGRGKLLLLRFDGLVFVVHCLFAIRRAVDRIRMGNTPHQRPKMPLHHGQHSAHVLAREGRSHQRPRMRPSAPRRRENTRSEKRRHCPDTDVREGKVLKLRCEQGLDVFGVHGVDCGKEEAAGCVRGTVVLEAVQGHVEVAVGLCGAERREEYVKAEKGIEGTQDGCWALGFGLVR